MRRISDWFIAKALQSTDNIFEKAKIEFTFKYTVVFYVLLLFYCISLVGSPYHLYFILSLYPVVVFPSVLLVLRKSRKATRAGYLFTAIYLTSDLSYSLVANFNVGFDSVVWVISGIVYIFFVLDWRAGLFVLAYQAVKLSFGIVNASMGYALFDLHVPREAIPMADEGSPLPLLMPLVLIGYGLYKTTSVSKLAEVKINEQKKLLEERARNITDSIIYAKRIQEAMLPSSRLIKNSFSDSFIFYQPKDIVAGDFYWLEEVGDTTIIAVADCTGHGVPGAMLNVVCHNAMNRAVREFGLSQPGVILDKVTGLVIEAFIKGDHEVKDGMDIALCSINRKEGKFEYAGANNSMYFVCNGKLMEVKPDKQPVGKHSRRQPYTNHSLDIESVSCFYLFSDGFADQFGGPKGKKFKYKPFQELLLANHRKPMEEQKIILSTIIEDWRGQLEQVDDICILGLRV